MHTRQRAIEWLLSCVTAHMGSQCVATSMRYALSRAIAPFAAVLLLPCANVVLVEMLNQVVHVLHVSRLAAFPFAHGDLLLAIVVVLRHARVVVRRGRHRAVRILGQLIFLLWRHNVDVGGRRRRRAHIQAWSLTRAVVVVAVWGGFMAVLAVLDILGEVVGGVV